MGLPSMSIYVTELVRDYGVQQLVRVGSCGAICDALKLCDVVLAIGASTDSSMNRIRFGGHDYCATADFDLLRAAADAAERAGVAAKVGRIFSADSFYTVDLEPLLRMEKYGVIAVEMEANALYTIAAGAGRRALTICTV